MAFRLVVPADCTVELNGALAVTVDCVDGEVELTVTVKIPVKPPVPSQYWQDVDIPNPLDIEDENGLPF